MKYKSLALPLLLASALLCLRCEHKCKYKPAPIFAAGLPHITQYNFERKDQQSLESLLLDTGVLLEIYQDVCDQTRQEYRFRVPGGNRGQYPDSLWVKEASRQLVFLSSFSPQQSALKVWADVLEEERQKIRLGEDHPVQPGVTVKIDRIISPEESTLVLVFSQE